MTFLLSVAVASNGTDFDATTADLLIACSVSSDFAFSEFVGYTPEVEENVVAAKSL